MSFDHCLVSLDLANKLPVSKLRDLSQKYTRAGIGIDAAMRIVLHDQLEQHRTQEKAIVAAVRSAWEEQGRPGAGEPPRDKNQAPDLNEMFTQLLAEEAAAKPKSDDLNAMFNELLAEVSGVDPRPTVAEVVDHPGPGVPAKTTSVPAKRRTKAKNRFATLEQEAERLPHLKAIYDAKYNMGKGSSMHVDLHNPGKFSNTPLAADKAKSRKEIEAAKKELSFLPPGILTPEAMYHVRNADLATPEGRLEVARNLTTSLEHYADTALRELRQGDWKNDTEAWNDFTKKHKHGPHMTREYFDMLGAGVDVDALRAEPAKAPAKEASNEWREPTKREYSYSDDVDDAIGQPIKKLRKIDIYQALIRKPALTVKVAERIILLRPDLAAEVRTTMRTELGYSLKGGQWEKVGRGTMPARAMDYTGRPVDGGPVQTGDVFKTSSGRETTEYPKGKGERPASNWLIENAKAEAEARGDDMNAHIFGNTKPLKSGDLTEADRMSMLEYLFGEQPAVKKSILKPLAPAAGPALTGSASPEAHIRKFAKTPYEVPNEKIRKVLLDAGQMAPQVAAILGEQPHLVTEVGRVMDEFGYKFDGFDGPNMAPIFTKPGTKPAPDPTTRSAGEAAASAGKNIAASFDAAVDGLGELFGLGDKNRSSWIELDESKYQKAVPFFQAAIAHFGNAAADIRDVMRAVIQKALEKFGREDTAKLQPYVVRFIDDYRNGKFKGESNVDEGAAGSAARDQGHRPDEKPAAEQDIFDVGGAVDGAASGTTRQPDGAGREQVDSTGVSGRDAVADREEGGSSVHERAPGSDGRAAEPRDTAGSGDGGRAGARPVGRAEGDAGNAADARGDAGGKLAQQRQAASVPVQLGDRDNIDATLPYLLEPQRGDVHFAEKRFASAAEGKMPGVLFTNGTGTGKTATGAGIIARQIRAGKTEGIIVVPNTGIAQDWIEFAGRLGVELRMLESTSENGGHGAVITTYANFGQNRTLADRHYDWALADESHYLMSAKDGDMTDALATFRALTRHPDGYAAYHRMLRRDIHDQLGAITNKESPEAKELFRQLHDWHGVDLANYNTKPAERPKAIFLSATPFAYVKSVDYAEGYLFHYPEDGKIGNSNQDGRAKFFVQHFGYRIRYHKLTQPDGNVDVGLMARQFNSWLKQEGALSGRMLEVDHDYGRRFVKVQSALGEKIDEGMDFMREHPEYKHLYGPFMKQFNYLKRRYLLEAIKAKEALPQIHQHLDMGRKVIIIHDYKKGGGRNPFSMEGINGTTTAYDSSMSPKSIDLAALAEKFKAERPDLVSLQIPALSALQTLRSAFPNALVHNGDIPEKQLEQNKVLFNSDDSGRNIIILQSDKGREGISLHDTTGVHQRVEVNVGMPGKPTALIQLEGRAYRTGQKSDAVFDYIITGTNWERWTFAQTIAERTDIAEALAMGDDARALKDSIVEAYEDAGPHAITSSDGTGGKARDRQAAKLLSDWDRAKSFYYSQLKRNSSTKALEGKDYFATPEPVGLKMVEWADIRPGEDVLEPSAGHGAIARWFPTLSNKTINERETELIGKARLVVDGKARFIQGNFEDLDLVNKYDAIVMNPPFGKGGSDAIPHLAKAYQHLREGGRIVALLPRGPAADGRLEKFLHGEDAPKDLFMVADIELPHSTFERAGTTTPTHIVVLDKIGDPEKAPNQVSRNYVNAEDINDLFDRIQHASIPGRVKTTQPLEIQLEQDKPAPKKQPREAAAGATGAERYYSTFEFKHTKTGEQLYGAAMLNRTSMDTYKQAAAIAKEHGGWYNKFVGGGALRGFLFKDADSRAEFMQQAGQLAEVAEGHDQGDDAGGMTFDSIDRRAGQRSTPDRRTHTVQVDGERRPIENANGQLLAADMNQQLNFWRWAGDTKVVDDHGRPLVVYHGTPNGGFSSFSESTKGERTGHSSDDVGYHFTSDPGYAEAYSEGYKLESIEAYRGMFGEEPAGTKMPPGAATYPVYLRLQNPLMVGASKQINKELIERAKTEGHDGIIADMGGAREYVVFAPEQIKSATGNSGRFDPASGNITENIDPRAADLMADGPLRADTEPRRVATTQKLKALRDQLESGKINAEQHADEINRLIRELDRRNMAKGMAEATRDRERGPEWIEERLMRAARLGELAHDDVAFARWLLNEAPHLAEDLGISLRTRNGATAGQYNHLSRIITLFKGHANPDTTVHEILHHTERMMPEDVQARITKAWQDAWTRAYNKADPKTKALLLDMLEMSTDREARERIHKAFADGRLDYDAHYQLANPSEYWAVNATRLMKGRYEAGSWIGKAKRWLGELWEKAKGLLGLPSDAPVLAGLRAVLDGTGARVSPLMLAERRAGRQLRAMFESQAANDESAGANTSPLTMAARRRFDQVMAEAEHWLKSNGKTASLTDLEPRWAMDHLDMMMGYGTGQFSEQAKAQGRAIWDRAQAAYKALAQRGGELEQPTSFENIARGPVSTWATPTDGRLDGVVQALQDMHLDTKQVVKAVRDTIGDLGDKWDPYLQEELYHGRTATGFKDFLHDELRPLLSDMQARGISMPDLEEYLHMRHAEEANDYLASINDATGNPDGLAGVSTQDARDYLANLPPAKAAAFAQLAARVDAIIKGTQDLTVHYGLEKQSTIDTWNNTYRHYVPLHREDMEHGMMGNGTGSGFSVRGPATRARTGSKRAVVDILGNIAMAREKTIVRGEKNRIAMALYGLALQAPNPTFWKPINPKKNPAALDAELLGMGLSPAERANLGNEPRDKRVGRDGQVERYINMAARSRDNVVAVRVNGEDRFLFFNKDNPSALRMAQAMKNIGPDVLGWTLGKVAWATRQFAALNTQYNPIFGIVNLVRDTGEAAINLSSTAIAGQQHKVLAEAGKLLAKVIVGRGRLENLKGADLALWHEFEQEGGITGFRQMFSRSEDRTAELARELRALTKNPILKAGSAVMAWLSDYNEALENITRLSAYKVAKESGLTNQRAASLAKNLTVNFNRKGSKTRILGALYAFFNASVQGIARMGQTLAGPAGKRIIAGGLLLGVLQSTILHVWGFDEADIPDFVRAKNLIIPASRPGHGKNYVTIPMPPGYAFLPALGGISTDFAIGGGKHAGRAGANVLATLLDTFNPLGSSTVSQTLSPTVGDPVVALSENKDWTGKDIALKDRSQLHPTPGHARAKDTASAVGKALSVWINAGTGGTKYSPGLLSPTPDQLDYLMGQFSGGVGREAMKAQQTVSAQFTGEDVPWNKVPLIGRFYGDVNDKSAISTRFYDNVKDLAEVGAELEGRRRDHVDTKAFRAEHPDYRLAEKSEVVLRELSDLRHQRQHWIEKGDKVRVKEFELRMRRAMEKFNNEVAKQRAPAQ